MAGRVIAVNRRATRAVVRVAVLESLFMGFSSGRRALVF
jgi:hypothetical protein